MQKQTIWLLTCLVCATVLLYFVFQIGLATWVRDQSVYVASSLDKERRLEQIPGKRLVLVGGSGLAMGLQSAYLQKITNRPVVNMGLHAALGLPFMLREALSGIRPGDTVILCPEYELTSGDPRLLSQLVDVNPKAYSFLNLTVSDHIRLRVQNMQRCLMAGFYKVTGLTKVDPIYNRQNFNKEGDVQGHYGLQAQQKLSDLVKIKN
uniref:hypothetical protein n=1 Tax=Spirosoma sp. TaxID=1899569 RepID=UPI003B3A9963